MPIKFYLFLINRMMYSYFPSVFYNTNIMVIKLYIMYIKLYIMYILCIYYVYIISINSIICI